MAELTCAMCGKPFESRYSSAKYCGTKCRAEGKRVDAAARYLQQKVNPKPAPTKEARRDRLSEDALEASKRGMSYGQYAAWKRTH